MKFFKSILLLVALAGFVLAQAVPNNPIQAVLYRSQTLTTPQKTQARANIDAPSTAFVGGTPVNGGVLYGTASNQAYSTAGTAGQILQSNGLAAPSFITTVPSAAALFNTSAASLDANADRGPGVRQMVHSTSSTNFPTTAGVTLESRRVSASASAVGTFQIDGSSDDGFNLLSYRKLFQYTTSEVWGVWRYIAPLDSPAFTGTPTLATAAQNTNNTQAASTAFVLGQASNTTPLIDGTATIGTGTTFARADHAHPTDTTRAALVSPALTGSPTAPTTAANNNSTTLATTAYVNAATGGVSPANGGLVYGTGTTQAVTAAGSSGQSIRSNGAAIPTWTGADWVINLTTAYTNATTTLTNTALTWAIAASARTGFYCLLNTSQSVTTLGLQVALTAPAGATGTYQYTWITSAGTAPSTAGALSFVSTATLGTALGGAAGLTATTLSTLEGVINNSTTAGSITVQAKASSAGTTTISAGSFCNYYAL